MLTSELEAMVLVLEVGLGNSTRNRTRPFMCMQLRLIKRFIKSMARKKGLLCCLTLHGWGMKVWCLRLTVALGRMFRVRAGEWGGFNHCSLQVFLMVVTLRRFQDLILLTGWRTQFRRMILLWWRWMWRVLNLIWFPGYLKLGLYVWWMRFFLSAITIGGRGVALDRGVPSMIKLMISACSSSLLSDKVGSLFINGFNLV